MFVCVIHFKSHSVPIKIKRYYLYYLVLQFKANIKLQLFSRKVGCTFI